MESTARLYVSERTEIDPHRINVLVRDMGSPSAERLVGRAMDEIADRLSIARAAYHSGDPAGVARSVRHMVPAARAIGLISIARVATDVLHSCESGDGAALAATLARLERLTDGAICAIGEAWSASV